MVAVGGAVGEGGGEEVDVGRRVKEGDGVKGSGEGMGVASRHEIKRTRPRTIPNRRRPLRGRDLPNLSLVCIIRIFYFQEVAMNLKAIRIEKPEAVNFILGQTHFIKTVEDVHEALVNAVPGIKFGLAFCEASGKCLVRWSGTDEAMIELAKKNALAIGAGHTFIVFLAEGYYPINVLNALKNVPEVCHIFCATANPTEVVVAETEQGCGVLGVVDGSSPLGVEEAEDIAWRKSFLRKIGYKL